MYVEIDSTNLISTPLTNVYAYLLFLVYNKKTRKYSAIHDTQLKRFNASKTVWGLSTVLQLDKFNDPKNGYIFDGDQCEFGVDILVSPSLTKWEVVSFDHKIPNPKFSWTIKNFTTLEEDPIESNKFFIKGRQWFLKLYPKGNSEAKGRSLSVYLYLADKGTLNEDEKIFKGTLDEDEKIFTRAHLRLVDPHGPIHHSETINRWYTKEDSAFGLNAFVPLDKLREAYLDDDGSLNLEIEFAVLSTSKYSLSI